MAENIGGQALPNGVLFRNKGWVAVGRRQQDEIILAVYATGEITGWKKQLSKIPIVRGILGFFFMFLAFIKVLGQKKQRGKEFWLTLGKRLLLFTFLFLIIPAFLDILIQPLNHYERLLSLDPTSSILGSMLDKFLTYLMVFFLFSFLVNLFYPALFAYHGAEHKAIMTYESHRPLVVEEAFQSSPLHPRCGTGFFAVIVILDSLFLTPILTYYHLTYTIFWQFFLIGLGYEVMLCLRKNCFLAKLFLPLTLFLQKMTTKEPNAQQLEVALAALKALPKN